MMFSEDHGVAKDMSTGRSISYDAGPGERGRSYQIGRAVKIKLELWIHTGDLVTRTC